jgi:ubiquinone/menaquinone biosynthesis C-methylase UbiE
METTLMAEHNHVCPWWIGYLLLSPLRRLAQNPKKMLAPYIEPGTIALDVGCGMGFFSLDMARMVGPEGKVVCVDLQAKMIKALVRRATKAGVIARIDHRVCDRNGLGLEDLGGKVGFALTFAIVHEVPDAEVFFHQIHGALRPGGTCLLAEPKGHVSEQQFEETIAKAEGAGFELLERPEVKRSRAALLNR